MAKELVGYRAVVVEQWQLDGPAYLNNPETFDGERIDWDDFVARNPKEARELLASLLYYLGRREAHA